MLMEALMMNKSFKKTRFFNKTVKHSNRTVICITCNRDNKNPRSVLSQEAVHDNMVLHLSLHIILRNCCSLNALLFYT